MRTRTTYSSPRSLTGDRGSAGGLRRRRLRWRRVRVLPTEQQLLQRREQPDRAEDQELRRLDDEDAQLGEHPRLRRDTDRAADHQRGQPVLRDLVAGHVLRVALALD